ncbi:TrmH family RNA methyltransferase [Halothermothrix orenii]|uniref:tRNA/rRNA methyltransferase (SpoU) n=1 Tax=Halothermothrix orenii (strain H 168 / OCM 544 / DSM 9562) TaxID=373903 RepID=B8D292_HALOH|nr:RNA methyltransferase [Halothermothrix orenii]ACL69319.1 tRNA/rRNA methyltransferase (SpoU) [Halothermothrix orenii H 168]
MKEVIKSSDNKNFKYLKKLYNKSFRKKEGKFILEGYRLIMEACGKARFDRIFMTPYFAKTDEGEEIIRKFKDHIPVHFVTGKLLYNVADTENPQGIAAITYVPRSGANILFHNRNRGIILILDRIQDPGNMGTIIRTAVAAGIEGIICLKGSVDIYNLKVIRASMGAIFSIPILTGVSFKRLQKIRDEYPDYKLICTDLNTSKFYHEIDYQEPLMLVIGNEARGIREELLSLADIKIKIPLMGNIDSLNAAVSTAIVLYDIVVKCRHSNG